MTNVSLELTDASTKLLLKMLNNIPMMNRDATWNQLYRDVKRIDSIWSRIEKEIKLNIQAKGMIKQKPKIQSDKI
jgi:hypothetical protein